MNQITPYTDGMRCFKVLPLVYDESLSYYEVLCKAVQKMNDIIDTINSFQAGYEGYTDTQVATLKEYGDGQDEKIIALINEQISTLENELQTRVKQVYETIGKTDETTRGWVLYELDKVYKYIVKYFTDTMQLYNPTNGELESLGKVINNIYDALRYFGISASDFDKLEINAYDYDAKMIYAKEYDLYGYEKLVKSPDFYMFSPFDGSYMYYQDIIYQLASLHASNPISASQYVAKGITTTAFVTYNMTAIDYDTKALIALQAHNSLEWADIVMAVENDYAKEILPIGYTLTENWTNIVAAQDYENPWRVNHFEDVETEAGDIIHGMWLQAVYAQLAPVQFSHQRAFYACPDGLAAGQYYLTLGASWGSNAVKDTSWNFTLTNSVPAGGRLAGFYSMPDTAPTNWKVYTYDAVGIELLETANVVSGASGTNLGVMQSTTRSGNMNSMQETAYGWNRWKTSALRQYLNSDAAAGEWWTAQDQWDIRPDQLATYAGYLSGLAQDMIDAIVPVKVTTYANTVNDGGVADVTYDKVTLISLQQMYFNPQIKGEGNEQDYWKQVNGTETRYAQGGTYLELRHYAIENHTSTQSVRFRSAGRGAACYAWFVFTSGIAYSSGASGTGRFAPLVLIAKSTGAAE